MTTLPPATSPAETTLYRGGRVHSPADPRATAFAVQDGRIAWLGTDDEADGMSAATTVDLHGALVTPAFVDAHVHTTAAGLSSPAWTSPAPPPSPRRWMRSPARRTRRGMTVLGHGWDETRWPGGRPPTVTEIDRAAPGVYVYLSRIDVHSAVVSSKLLTAVPGLRDQTGYRRDGYLTVDAHHAVRTEAMRSVAPPSGPVPSAPR